FSTILLRLPPRSTLFPYTTLFRSLVGERPVLARTQQLLERRRSPELTQPTDHFLKVRLQPFPDVHVIASVYFGAAVGATLMPYLDRKSTRLNSSHVKISYAVFCLK